MTEKSIQSQLEIIKKGDTVVKLNNESLNNVSTN